MRLLAWLGTVVCLLSTQMVSADAHMCRMHGSATWPMETMTETVTVNTAGSGRAASSRPPVSAVVQPSAQSHAEFQPAADTEPGLGTSDSITGVAAELSSVMTPAGASTGPGTGGVAANSATPPPHVPHVPHVDATAFRAGSGPSDASDWLWCVSADDPRCSPFDDGAEFSLSILRYGQYSELVSVPMAASWVMQLSAGDFHPELRARAGFQQGLLRPPN